MLVLDASRNGFRETGLGGASRGDVAGDRGLGDAARFRKGLLEESWRDKEADRVSIKGTGEFSLAGL